MHKRCYFSIITPSYNRAHLLKGAFDSLQEQNFTDFQWIIVDDGSTDDTAKVVDCFVKKAKFEIIYRKIKHGGKHFAVRAAYQIAAGEYAFELDSDDSLYDKNTLNNLWKLTKSVPDYPCIGGCFIDQHDGVFPKIDGEYIDYNCEQYLNVFCSPNGMEALNIAWLMKMDYARSILPPEIHDNLSYFPEAVINIRRVLSWSDFHVRIFNQAWYRYNMFNADSVSVNTYTTNAMWYYAKSLLETFYEYDLLNKYKDFCYRLVKMLFNHTPGNKSLFDNYKILCHIHKTNWFMCVFVKHVFKQIFSVNHAHITIIGIHVKRGK